MNICNVNPLVCIIIIYIFCFGLCIHDNKADTQAGCQLLVLLVLTAAGKWSKKASRQIDSLSVSLKLLSCLSKWKTGTSAGFNMQSHKVRLKQQYSLISTMSQNWEMRQVSQWHMFMIMIMLLQAYSFTHKWFDGYTRYPVSSLKVKCMWYFIVFIVRVEL